MSNRNKLTTAEQKELGVNEENGGDINAEELVKKYENEVKEGIEKDFLGIDDDVYTPYK